MRYFGVAYLAGTAAATLVFEDYVIDLVVGVPYACFAAMLAERRFRRAGVFLGVVLGWLLSIRLATHCLKLGGES